MNTIIQTPTSDLTDSLNFYMKLKFQTVSSSNPLLISDGQVVLEINPARTARIGIKMYAPSWKKTVSSFSSETPVLPTPDGYIVSAPSGTWVYLIENKGIPSFDLTKLSSSVLGSFAGISIETISMQKSCQFWEILGFTISVGAIEQGWLSLTNSDNTSISLMAANSCPHLFLNPSLTYFNGKKNEAIIEKIRGLDIPITEEITQFNPEGIVDNIIIQDAGGLGFFIFSD